MGRRYRNEASLWVPWGIPARAWREEGEEPRELGPAKPGTALPREREGVQMPLLQGAISAVLTKCSTEEGIIPVNKNLW